MDWAPGMRSSLVSCFSTRGCRRNDGIGARSPSISTLGWRWVRPISRVSTPTAVCRMTRRRTRGRSALYEVQAASYANYLPAVSGFTTSRTPLYGQTARVPLPRSPSVSSVAASGRQHSRERGDQSDRRDNLHPTGTRISTPGMKTSPVLVSANDDQVIPRVETWASATVLPTPADPPEERSRSVEGFRLLTRPCQRTPQ
jgi:hypothetical protein